jgi:hypothetical protein
MSGGRLIRTVAVLVYLLISQEPACLLIGDKKNIDTQLRLLDTFQRFEGKEKTPQTGGCCGVFKTSASSRLRIGVADLGAGWEASDDKEVSLLRFHS